jgi:amino acid transporter
MSSTQTQPAAHLRRALGLRELVFMGIIMVQPTAPMPLFGVAYQEARGHVVTLILMAMVAMLFTAISYGRMARAYPSAGSAYSYVANEIHPAAGFATGWSMLMDYVLNPLICTVWCAKALMLIVPAIPYWLGTVFFAGLFTILNLRGIQATARTNVILTLAMLSVVAAMLVASAKYLLTSGDLSSRLFLRPFYDPETFSLASLSTGASLAVLTFIGFDGISTLSEETRNPRRNILLGTVLTCIVIGALSAIEVYAAQLVWPKGKPFPDVDTAYVHVAGLAGGVVLFQLINVTLIVATIGSGSGAVLAGARLLFGMGREKALPSGFFAYLDPIKSIPRNNVLLIGALALAGSHLMSYQLGAELLNFGAFVGFMGVNLSAFLRYWVRGENRSWSYLVVPLLGFFICFYMWASLRTPAKIAGICWLTAGMLFGAWKTRGFKLKLLSFDDR